MELIFAPTRTCGLNFKLKGLPRHLESHALIQNTKLLQIFFEDTDVPILSVRCRISRYASRRLKAQHFAESAKSLWSKMQKVGGRCTQGRIFSTRAPTAPLRESETQCREEEFSTGAPTAP